MVGRPDKANGCGRGLDAVGKICASAGGHCRGHDLACRLYDGRHSGAELTNPDFQTYAKAFGVRSWRVTDAAGLRTALGEALAANAPCLVEVMTDITKEPSPFRFISPHRA